MARKKSTQDTFDENVKKLAENAPKKTAAKAKVKSKEKKDSIPKIKVKAGLGRDPKSDEQLIQTLENKYKLLKERKSHTAQIMMSEFDFLLELARERELDGIKKRIKAL